MASERGLARAGVSAHTHGVHTKLSLWRNTSLAGARVRLSAWFFVELREGAAACLPAELYVSRLAEVLYLYALRGLCVVGSILCFPQPVPHLRNTMHEKVTCATVKACAVACFGGDTVLTLTPRTDGARVGKPCVL